MAKVSSEKPTECDVSIFAATLSDIKMQMVGLQRIVSSIERSTKCAPNEKSVTLSAFFSELDDKCLIVNMGQKSDSAADRCNESDSESEEDLLFHGSYVKLAGKDNQK